MNIRRFLKYGLSTWKDHPEYVGRYQVSADGEVRNSHSEESLVISKSRRHRHGFVRLYRGGLCCDKSIPCLVLETFVGPCPKSMKCFHIDGDASNNSIENLSWS
jgi:hypothetical protein